MDEEQCSRRSSVLIFSLECSAMRNRGVNEAFTEAARVALQVKTKSDNSAKCSIM